MEKPLVSVILNVYNEADIIEKCLSLIRSQKYPQSKIEIILIDDYSTDTTIKLAKKFRVKVYYSGYRNRERSKSIGLQHAKGKYLLLLDADVFLKSNQWVSEAVRLLEKYPNTSAVQSIRWKYSKKENVINRYCDLFGINDPFVFFLGKRGALMATESEWPHKKTIITEGENYFITAFTPSSLPTLGAQGYMARKSFILETTWKPYFFHLDTAMEMVKQRHNIFIMSLLPIKHEYVFSFSEYYKKLYRNMYLFLELRSFRKYDYQVGNIKFFIALIVMCTGIIPFFIALRGYIKKPDIAWFLHPIFSMTVPWLYVYVTIIYKLSIWKKKIFVL